MKNQRIYIIGTGTGLRLVRAAHRAQALSHAARATMTIKVASQEDLVKAMTGGVQVEDVKDSDTDDLFELETAAA